MDDSSPRQKYIKRWTALETERSSWISHWRELSENILPRGRFSEYDRNKGDKKYNDIYDSTGTRALQTLAAGMRSGMTSPGRPWFRLNTPSPQLNKMHSVRKWLAEVEVAMRGVFDRSNIYQSLYSVYETLGCFGTAVCIIEKDEDKLIRGIVLPIGEFALATNDRDVVNTVYRKFDMTVAQLVEKFGIDNVSERTKNLYEQCNYDGWITVLHAIEPRFERDTEKKDAKNKPWRSVYIELGAESNKLLRESGFNRFPALAPRWTANPGDVYGMSPGMVALGDLKQLQHQQMAKSKTIAYQSDPPLQIPSSLKSADTLPGGVTYFDEMAGATGIRTAFDVKLDLQGTLLDIQDIRDRINKTYFADLFLLMSDTTKRMTATEVAERNSEKLIVLGPVLDRLQSEMLDPLIDMTFERLLEEGMLPPPPPELQGVNLRVEYVSMLAQAQQAVSLVAKDRFLGSLGMVAQMKPEVLDTVDFDEFVREYAHEQGVSPSIMRDEQEVEELREAASQMAQMQQMGMAAQTGADITKTLGDTSMEGSNALTAMADMVSQL